MNLEKDYVVVEKRAVEVNALADELAHAGAGADAIPNSRKNLDVDQTNRLASLQQQTETALYRRSSLSGSQNVLVFLKDEFRFHSRPPML